MAELPWNWKPPNASPAAKKEWAKPWHQRALEIIHPTPDTFRNVMLAMIESFTTRELHEAVLRRLDMVDAFITVAKLRHPFVKPLAKLALQQNSYYAFSYLVGWAADGARPAVGGPGLLVQELARRDPVKGRILSAPDGWTWLQTECYHLAIFFREFAHLDRPPYNWPTPSPPPGCPPYVIPKLEDLLKLRHEPASP